MNHAELCPVCQGHGKVAGFKTCHGCCGIGWVTVQDQPAMPAISPILAPVQPNQGRKPIHFSDPQVRC